jgi:hypothetical protein
MRMEDLLDLYAQPDEPGQPVICVDERPCQLLSDPVPSLPLQPGKPAKVDYQDDREGTCCLFVAVEPLTGFRFVQVRERRTNVDYAEFLQAFAALPQYAAVMRFRGGQDNLNTHTAGAFSQAFAAETARQLKQRFEYHATPPPCVVAEYGRDRTGGVSQTMPGSATGDHRRIRPRSRGMCQRTECAPRENYLAVHHE